MFTVTRYPHGSFCWADLSTHGGEAAVDFYSQLMGWQAETQDTVFGTTYTTFSQDGHRIAGLAWLPPEMSEIPSAWNNYVSVDDVDALLPTVTEGGGQIIQPPFDVPEGARIAVIADPAGAALCLFQARGNVGTTLVNTPGALCWNELWTADLRTSKAFYGALFGWTFESDPKVPIYTILLNRGRRNGGILAMGEEMAAETAPVWVPHFSVADIEAAARRIVDLGGTVQVGPRDDGDGKRWLLFADPQGAHCYLLQLDNPEPWLEHEA